MVLHIAIVSFSLQILNTECLSKPSMLCRKKNAFCYGSNAYYVLNWSLMSHFVKIWWICIQKYVCFNVRPHAINHPVHLTHYLCCTLLKTPDYRNTFSHTTKHFIRYSTKNKATYCFHFQFVQHCVSFCAHAGYSLDVQTREKVK